MSENKILLHACCAPCAEYPVADLLERGFRPDLLYYNPNIHPRFEYDRRWEQVIRLGEIRDLSASRVEDFRMQDWLDHTWKGKYDSRCEMCYSIRMEYVASYAREHGYSAFSSSLLVSPYQQHDRIAKIAEEAARHNQVEFAYYDWRPHFREGQAMAREDGLYRQKYCGCIFSLDDSEWKEKIIRDFPEGWEASR